METNLLTVAGTTATPKTSLTGLDTVRAKARRQHSVSLKRESENGENSGRNSHQKIKTLKSLAAGEEVLNERSCEGSLIERAWDWFLRAIGNR